MDSSSAFGLGSWRKREERGKGQNRGGGEGRVAKERRNKRGGVEEGREGEGLREDDKS